MNRKSQNDAFSEFNELEKRLTSLRPLILEVLTRASGDSDLRRNVGKHGDLESGTPPPYYADPTGETAMRKRFADSVELKVSAMAEHIHYALNLAKTVLDVTPPDVAERARREVPDCLACGQPSAGKIHSGYCPDCYKAWEDGGFRDRKTFERRRKESEWRISAINGLQGSGVLPKGVS